MPNIIPKLNLNKTPSIVENNSLVFAKNIRLDVDNTIHADYGLQQDIDITEYGFDEIIGHIEENNGYYLFLVKYNNENHNIDNIEKTAIYHIYYNKLENGGYSSGIEPISCNWTWHGGNITGYVTLNLIGDTILTIGEYFTNDTNILVPLKHININICKITDDESIYTQAPCIPITNLLYKDTFEYSIPNGTYQFFIRYKIRNDFYTNWFPASRELFAGNTNYQNTIFGTAKYVDVHLNSDFSFIFEVNNLYPEYNNIYESFQIGFILTSDDAQYAKVWKHFSLNTNIIYFDINENDIIDTEISNFLQPTYNLFNVNNITSFKNKIYISNYIETNHDNLSLQTYANDIDIKFTTIDTINKVGKYEVITEVSNNSTYIKGYKDENNKNIRIESWHVTDTEISAGAIEKSLFSKTFSNNSSNPNNAFIDSDNQNNLKIVIENPIPSCLFRLLNNQTLPANGITSDTKYGFYFTIDNSDTVEQCKNTAISLFKKEFNINHDKVSATLSNAYTPKINNTFIRQSHVNVVNSGKFIEDKIKEDTFILLQYITQYNTDKGFYKSHTPYYINNKEQLIDKHFDVLSPFVITREIKFRVVDTNTGKNREIAVTQTIRIKLNLTTTLKTILDNSNFDKYTTLIPYQCYKFYVHYVTKFGEITNGFLCSKPNIIQCPYINKANTLVYPIFSNITIPNNYAACFFTMQHVTTRASTVFNIKTIKEADIDLSNSNGIQNVPSITIGQNFDINCRTLPLLKNITLQQDIDNVVLTTTNNISSNSKETNINTSNDVIDINTPIEQNKPSIDFDNNINVNKTTIITSGDFYHSGDSSIPKLFGANGKIVFNDYSNIDKDSLVFTVSEFTENNDTPNLIKCTPYLKSNIYNDYHNLNLNGFLCKIYPLDGFLCKINSLNGKYHEIDADMFYYTDATDVYHKTVQWHSTNYDRRNIVLDDFDDGKEQTQYSNGVLLREDITDISSKPIYIYSNYNLNYVTLQEDIKQLPIRFYKIGDNKTVQRRYIHVFNSLVLSTSYKLPSMYEKYIRPVYDIYKSTNIYKNKYDNTIRSSVLYGDEERINMFKFLPNDYYNVPSNRGIITNLISVGNSILVHTIDSLFAFSGNNTINSSQGEILPSESQPFDTGINELFGSDFGFAGLQNKKDSIITEQGYIFFDRDSHIIYMYSGNNQLQKISESIEKLFRRKDIVNITFANDYYNNRIFVCIHYLDKTSVTLSFSVLESVKSFISTHDFKYNDSFNTKAKCYFINDNNTIVYKIDKTIINDYKSLSNINKIYPYEHHIAINDKDYNRFYSIVDIIYNNNYEYVKTLNAVNWCSNDVIAEFKDIDEQNITDNIPNAPIYAIAKIADVLYKNVPCAGMFIYTDTTSSEYFKFDKISNNEPLLKEEIVNDKLVKKINSDSIDYPRYNNGYWSFNAFRNIENTIDIFNYLNNDTNTPLQYGNYVSDMNSLIQGKYIVVRLFFNSKFKLETLSLNCN